MSEFGPGNTDWSLSNLNHTS